MMAAPTAEIAKLDQELTFCRRELLEIARIASDQHNAMVAYIRSHQEDHSGDAHMCEICDAVKKLQRRVSKHA